MSNGLISLPPLPASPPGSVVAVDGWYPPVDVNGVRARMRVGPIVTDTRLRSAIVAAIIAVDRELAIWRLTQILSGHLSLATVPALVIDGMSARVLSWRRAVDNHAMADLAETHRDIGVTVEGGTRADDMASSADSYRREATHAVRDVLGVTRTSVAML